MEIEKGQTIQGRTWIRFADCDVCEVHKGQNFIRFSIKQSAYIFSQKDIKSLLPYLQSFAESGTLEPTPLQGDLQEKDLEGNLERASELSFALVKRIEALEKLVREWMQFGLTPDVNGSLAWADLNLKTVCLLSGE